MFEKNAEFLVEPVAIEYIKLPDGQNDIWLRKNIVKKTVRKFLTVFYLNCFR